MTPEERAEERYPCESSPKFDGEISYGKSWREAAATIFREQVEPLEAERDKLRALVQELTNRLHKERLKYSDIVDMLNIDHGLLSAKEQGFVPTNTEDK